MTRPGYLLRAELVSRIGPHELRVEAFDRWGDSLEDQLAGVLATDIELLAPGTIAAPFPWRGGQAPDLTVQLRLTRFDADATGKVRLEGDWTLLKAGADGPLVHKVASVSEQASNREVDEIVAAMSRALGELARQIATELAAASGGQAPSTSP